MKRFCCIVSIIAFTLGVTSCAKSSSDTEEQAEKPTLHPLIQARYDALDSVLEIPDDLTEEQRLVFIENHVLTTPITADELLALRPIHTLDPDTTGYGNWWSEQRWEQIRLANRFMRMQFVAFGEPMNEWQWLIAVQKIVADYAAPFGINEEQALDSLYAGADHLCAGTQYQINLCTYVMSSIEYYKTLAAYRSFINQLPEAQQALFIEEYAAWNKLNKARFDAYTDIRRANSHYSALPMELEGMYAAYAECRRQILTQEQAVILSGKNYRQKHPVVRTKDWNTYLQSLYNQATDEDSTIVQTLDETTKEWIAIRQKIANQLPEPQQTAYDNLTADYHWIITNEQEHVPPMYQ